MKTRGTLRDKVTIETTNERGMVKNHVVVLYKKRNKQIAKLKKQTKKRHTKRNSFLHV